MSELSSLLEAARLKAFNGGIPLRRKDGALYALLSGCLFICEKVQREGLEQELRDAVRVRVDIRGKDNAGKGRRFAFKESDAFVLVSRYILSQDSRNSVYRYASTLREASAKNIQSSELQEWLKKNGGVRALFMGRDITPRLKSTKTLHLTTGVEYPTDKEFTITLRYNGKGSFDVV